jgi:hypothetical protein
VHKLDSARNKTDSLINSFDVSLMSNTKWVKLLNALSKLNLNNAVTTVKLIWDSEVRSFRLDSDIEFNFDYYPSSVESLVSGYPKGFYDYKEIEWLTINTSASNLKLIDDSLSEIGQFCVNKSTSSIQVFAYKNT